MKKAALIMTIFACALSALAAPPYITHTTESDWQQTQSLEAIELQQGASVQLRERLTTGGKYLDLTGLTARWEGRSSITSTQALQVTSTLTQSNSTPHYFQFDLDSTETGTAVTNWVWSLIVVSAGEDYVIGTGELDIVESAWTGASAILTNITTQTAIDASIATHAADVDAHHARYTDAEALAAAIAGGCVTSAVEYGTSTFTNNVRAAQTNDGYEADTTYVDDLASFTNAVRAAQTNDGQGVTVESDPVWTNALESGFSVGGELAVANDNITRTSVTFGYPINIDLENATLELNGSPTVEWADHILDDGSGLALDWINHILGNGAWTHATDATTGTQIVNYRTATNLVSNLANSTNLPVAGIDATGTPDATTFLRGDGSWQVPAGGGGGGFPVTLGEWYDMDLQDPSAAPHRAWSDGGGNTVYARALESTNTVNLSFDFRVVTGAAVTVTSPLAWETGTNQTASVICNIKYAYDDTVQASVTNTTGTLGTLATATQGEETIVNAWTNTIGTGHYRFEFDKGDSVVAYGELGFMGAPTITVTEP